MKTMNENEINCYLDGHENAMFKILAIISNNIEKIPVAMITELENFNNSIQYQSEAMIDNLTSHTF